ncbi:MAG: TIGR00300 family protein [Candidatus Altiarchaeales archaeon IMC4]|nr:MAG: TIGR00300 family protein [Candidatus Altiarchaeales archaeon IMC4]
MKETIELKGHIIDSLILPKVLDTIMDMEGQFEILKLDVGKTKKDTSHAVIAVDGSEELFDELEKLGALLPTKKVETKKAPKDNVLPDGFYGTTHHPTYVYLKGRWQKVKNLEMDCVIAIEGEKAVCKRQGLIKKGDEIVVGMGGVRVEAPQRSREPEDIFGFMSSEISPEKPVNAYIKDLAAEMKKIHGEKGFIIHVVGTAIAHTGADEALAELVRMGYVNALFTGNGFATMDIEKQLFGTTLGMDRKTGRILKRGYKSHLVAINEMWKAGGIKKAVEKGVLKGGVMYECVKNRVPFVVGGSLRDDGPLPDTITDVMAAQDEMRKYVQKAGMCMIYASMLHGIATGNMLPSRVKTVCIDINPYVVTRLQDRGTTQALGIVSDPAVILPRLVDELRKK